MHKSSFTITYKKFCKILIHARKTAGITQRELSAKLSRPQSFVSKYERGERRLDVIEFLEVAKALGRNPHILLRQIKSQTPE